MSISRCLAFRTCTTRPTFAILDNHRARAQHFLSQLLYLQSCPTAICRARAPCSMLHARLASCDVHFSVHTYMHTSRFDLVETDACTRLHARTIPSALSLPADEQPSNRYQFEREKRREVVTSALARFGSEISLGSDG